MSVLTDAERAELIALWNKEPVLTHAEYARAVDLEEKLRGAPCDDCGEHHQSLDCPDDVASDYIENDSFDYVID